MGLDAASLVLRRSLQGFRPFELVVEGLALGESAQTAMRKAGQLLDLEPTHMDRLEILLKWGAELGILENSDGYKLVEELRDGSVEKLSLVSPDDLESEAKARIYNAKTLGRAAYSNLDDVDRQLLATALLEHATDPRQSVEDSGQAFEDFLRNLAGKHGYSTEAKKLNGAGQLADLLVGKGVIHGHQHKLASAISSPRNAVSHRKDKKTLVPWDMTPEGAFATHTMTLVVIRSIHEYSTTKRQVI